MSEPVALVFVDFNLPKSGEIYVYEFGVQVAYAHHVEILIDSIRINGENGSRNPSITPFEAQVMAIALDALDELTEAQ